MMKQNSGLRNFINKIISDIDPHLSNVAVFYRNEWIENQAKRIKKGSKVLDVGAGTVPYRKYFSHCIYKTHDFNQYEGQKKGPLQENWQYGQIDYVSDILNIPVKNSSFDVIICTEVFEHIPEPIKAIHELSRILKKGGKLLLTAPLASGLHQEPYHFYGGFTPHFYRHFFPKYNLKIIKITPTGGLFKHAAQELHRSAIALWGQRRINPIFTLILAKFLPKFLSNFDNQLSIPEFTMDYLIEARKV